jgi:hypothetical protein
VDPNKSVSQAIGCEVWEEKGLVVEDWTLESFLYGIFCVGIRLPYSTIPEPEVPIQAHHLVIYSVHARGAQCFLVPAAATIV